MNLVIAVFLLIRRPKRGDFGKLICSQRGPRPDERTVRSMPIFRTSLGSTDDDGLHGRYDPLLLTNHAQRSKIKGLAARNIRSVVVKHSDEWFGSTCERD